MKNTERPFVVDGEDFLSLTPDLREGIRAVEKQNRTTVTEMMTNLAPWPDIAAAVRQAGVPELLDAFMRNLLPFFESLDEMRANMKDAERAVHRANRRHLN